MLSELYGLRTLSKSDSLHISSPPIIRLSPCIINEIDHAPAPDFVENVGDGNDVDDAPDGRPSHGKLTSSSGGCEASKSAGKSQLVMRIRRLTRLPRWSRRPVLLEMESQQLRFHALDFNNAYAFLFTFATYLSMFLIFPFCFFL
ncbi:uncharacterized protein LOC130499591 [Raphanus sativus]|uniref:Uncharacterized protein LOC130499591 n=1 Tax=Raphanus sativus TaxID=3726 RepID=A0A9W3CE71_RAPSA|nr:uncharacterized protein LOC130499591 [Raphanus sativus]